MLTHISRSARSVAAALFLALVVVGTEQPQLPARPPRIHTVEQVELFGRRRTPRPLAHRAA